MGLRACFLLLLAVAGCSAPRLPPEDPPPPATPPPARPSPAPSEAPNVLNPGPTIGWFPIQHHLPVEQRVNTPVPLYFEPPSGSDVAQAILHFKPFGAAQYKKVSMARLGTGFAYEIPCMEVTTTGDLKYYIELWGAEGQLLESLGSRMDALRVHILIDLEGDPPSLPGKSPPHQCRDYDAPRRL